MEKDEIVKCVDDSIKKLIQVFCEKPYFFYTENDMHCCLYQLIYKNMNGKGNWYTIINGKKKETLKKDTLPVHKEYPTIKLYTKNKKPTRKHFDIVIFREGYINFAFKNSKTSNSSPTEPFIAIQIGLDCNSKHLENDWKSLKEVQNCVKYRYLLHFDRKSHRENTIESVESVKEKVNEYKSELKGSGGVCYINVSNPSEPIIEMHLIT